MERLGTVWSRNRDGDWIHLVDRLAEGTTLGHADGSVRAAIAGLGAWDLWVVNADGSGESQLTKAPGLTGFASWGEMRAGR